MEHTFSAAAMLLALTAAAVIGLFALTGYFGNSEETLAAESSFPEQSEESARKMSLGIFDGKLALYIGESPYPNTVYDFMARTLPEEDQKRLSEGIEISSEEELQSLLEDFMS